jgi:hypothetical protein
LCWRTLNKDIKSNINTESIVYHVVVQRCNRVIRRNFWIFETLC